MIETQVDARGHWLVDSYVGSGDGLEVAMFFCEIWGSPEYPYIVVRRIFCDAAEEDLTFAFGTWRRAAMRWSEMTGGRIISGDRWLSPFERVLDDN